MLTTTDYSAIEDSIQNNYDAINNKIDSSIIYGYIYQSGDEVGFNIGVSSFKALIISAYVYVRNNHTYRSGYVFVLNNNSTSADFADGGALGGIDAGYSASVNGSGVKIISTNSSMRHYIYYVVFT